MYESELKSYLRCLKTVLLAPTKGGTTLSEAKDVFTGWLDSEFQNWGTDVSGEDTAQINADVYEVLRDGDYKTLFGSLSDPRKLCLTQGQIKEFCRSHRDSLRQEGYGTFFLFWVSGELFVADVFVDGHELKISANRFDRYNVWKAVKRYRLVVTQPTTRPLTF